MKKALIISSIVVFAFSLSDCSYIDSNKYEPFTLWVYAVCKDDAYKIDVAGNKLTTITCHRKDMDGFDISKIVEQKEVKLTNKEKKEIYETAEKIHKNYGVGDIHWNIDPNLGMCDAWLLRFEYNGTVVIQPTSPTFYDMKKKVLADMDKDIVRLYEIFKDKSLIKIDVSAPGIFDYH